MISLEVENKADSKWNERLIESGLGTIYQTAEIAQHFRNIKQKPLFLKFIDIKGSIVGQLLIRESSYSNKESFKRKLLKKFLGSQQLCQWSYGPLIFDENLKFAIYEQLGNFLLEKNYRVSGVEHPLCNSGAEKLQKKFSLIKWATFLVDLAKPLDELYQNISKHNGRKNIERSQKRGVIIEEINEKTLRNYCEMKNQTKIDSEEDIASYQNFLSWWKLLKPLGYTGFIAKKK